MGLFDNQPITIEEVKERMIAGSDGDTIRRVSATGKVYTARHKPWWMLLGKGPEGKTCHDCTFLQRGTYPKCERQIITSGPGTDIRHKDHACRLFTSLHSSVP